MAKLIYWMNISIDGFVEDVDGNFEWGTPDEDEFKFITELYRPIGTHLYGRRMYETMVYWGTAHTREDQPPFMQEFGQLWRAADKIVYSTKLETVSSANTRIDRDFDATAIREMKSKVERDIVVGGPDLAAQAVSAGLVDEYYLFIIPIAVGRGKPFLPNDVRLKLALIDERRFENGVVHLRYRSAP